MWWIALKINIPIWKIVRVYSEFNTHRFFLSASRQKKWIFFFLYCMVHVTSSFDICLVHLFSSIKVPIWVPLVMTMTTQFIRVMTSFLFISRWYLFILFCQLKVSNVTRTSILTPHPAPHPFDVGSVPSLFLSVGSRFPPPILSLLANVCSPVCLTLLVLFMYLCIISYLLKKK